MIKLFFLFMHVFCTIFSMEYFQYEDQPKKRENKYDTNLPGKKIKYDLVFDDIKHDNINNTDTVSPTLIVIKTADDYYFSNSKEVTQLSVTIENLLQDITYHDPILLTNIYYEQFHKIDELLKIITKYGTFIPNAEIDQRTIDRDVKKVLGALNEEELGKIFVDINYLDIPLVYNPVKNLLVNKISHLNKFFPEKIGLTGNKSITGMVNKSITGMVNKSITGMVNKSLAKKILEPLITAKEGYRIFCKSKVNSTRSDEESGDIIVFSPDEKYILSAEENITVINTDNHEDKKEFHTLKESLNKYSFIAISVKGSIAASDKQGNIYFWAANNVKNKSPNILSTLERKPKIYKITGALLIPLAFFPCGNKLIFGKGNTAKYRDVMIIDLKSGKMSSFVEPTSHESGIKAIKCSPSGQKVAIAYVNNDIKVFNVANRTLLYQVSLKGKPTSIAFSPDETILAAASFDGKIILWDAENGMNQRALERPRKNNHKISQPKSHDYAVKSIMFSPCGKLLLSGSNGDYAFLWNTTSYKHFHSLTDNKKIFSVSFSSQGQIATITPDGTVSFYISLGFCDDLTINEAQILHWVYNGKIDEIVKENKSVEEKLNEMNNDSRYSKVIKLFNKKDN